MWFKRNPDFGQNREFSWTIVQENFQNRKYENVPKITWTLPQILRGSRICSSFVRRMNIYWTTDLNKKTGSRKKKHIIKNLTSELCWWNSYRQFSLKNFHKTAADKYLNRFAKYWNWLFWQLKMIEKPSKKRISNTLARKKGLILELLHRQRV
jgi:hypothetical protein